MNEGRDWEGKRRRGERGWEVGGKWGVRASMLLPVMKTYTVERRRRDRSVKKSESKNYREEECWGGEGW